MIGLFNADLAAVSAFSLSGISSSSFNFKNDTVHNTISAIN